MVEEGETTRVTKPRRPIGFRHVQVFMLFLGLALAYSMRVSMSMAIVAMTTHQGNHQELKPFDWSIGAQAIILSTFMAGYVISQIPGRRLSAKFGGKVFMAVGVAGSAAMSAFLPLGAYDGDWQLSAANRFIQGLAQGAMVPAVLNLIDKWIPSEERKWTEQFIFSGMWFGTSVQFLNSGFVINAWGWPALFYLNTVTGGIWSIAYIILGSNSAEKSRFISEDERVYIRQSLRIVNDHEKCKTPWYALWTSLPFLSLVVANCAQNWGLWTLMTLVPTYLNQTQDVGIVINGLVTAVPYFGMFLMVIIFRLISDQVISKKCLHVTTTRKVFTAIGFIGPSIGLFSLSLLDNEIKITGLVLTLVMALNAALFSGYVTSHDDMAPNFSWRMKRITNGFADLLSIFAPVVAGAMLEENGDPDNWSTVFNLCAVIYAICCIFYIAVGTSAKQQWNEPFDSNNNSQTPNRIK